MPAIPRKEYKFYRVFKIEPKDKKKLLGGVKLAFPMPDSEQELDAEKREEIRKGFRKMDYIPVSKTVMSAKYKDGKIRAKDTKRGDEFELEFWKDIEPRVQAYSPSGGKESKNGN